MQWHGHSPQQCMQCKQALTEQSSAEASHILLAGGSRAVCGLFFFMVFLYIFLLLWSVVNLEEEKWDLIRLYWNTAGFAWLVFIDQRVMSGNQTIACKLGLGMVYIYIYVPIVVVVSCWMHYIFLGNELKLVATASACCAPISLLLDEMSRRQHFHVCMFASFVQYSVPYYPMATKYY